MVAMPSLKPKPTKHRYWWVLLFGLIVVALCAWFRAYLDLWLQGSRIGFGQLPVAPVAFLVFLLWFVQPILRRLGIALTRAELALLFCLLFATTRFWSSSYAVLPLSLGVAAFYYASPVNNYELLHPYIPRWLVPQDKLVVKAFYEGSPDSKVPWRDWLPALSAWTLSTMLLWICLMGLTLLFQRRWIDEEKLVFPVAQVPLAMMEEQKAVWNSKPFWLGFLFPILLHSWNGLAFYFPAIPSLNLHSINITSLFTEPPWVIISYEGAPVGFYPSVIGVAYMTSTEVALGLWFFHFLINLEMVVLYALGFPPGGYDHGGIRAITRGQEIGAFFALCGVLAWGIWQKRKTAVLTKGEKVSFFVFTAGLIALTAFWSFMGADWWASLAYFTIFFVVMLVLARLSCQAGSMFVAMDFHPHNISGYLFGQMGVGFRNLIVLMFPYMAYMMERDVAPLPYLMNSAKIAAEADLDDKFFLWGLSLACLVASVAAPIASLKVLYHRGGLNLHYHYATRLARWAWDKYIGWFRFPAPSDIRATTGILGGILFMLLMTYLHHWLPRFPLHPLGFAMADSLVIRKVWFSVFLGWLAKGLVLRYGGHRVYWTWRPAFIGMVVGELMAAAIWLLIDMLFQSKGHDVFPGFPPL